MNIKNLINKEAEMRSLILVLSPEDQEFVSQVSSLNWWPPVGLLSIATYVNLHNKDAEIKILDGTRKNLNNMLTEIHNIANKPGQLIVGIQPACTSFNNSLRIAEYSKNLGATIIFGGHYADHLAKWLLINFNYIDYVVKGDGEIPVSLILKGTDLEDIPGLVYRDKNNNIFQNQPIRVDLNELPEVDYSFIDINSYFLTNQPKFFGYYSQKGCQYREATGGCLFCTRADKGFRYIKPNKIWNLLSKWHQEYGIEIFTDACDDIMSSQQWFNAFAQYKPKDFGFYFLARANRINEQSAKQLKNLNTKIVLLGIESGSDKMLRSGHKGTNTAINNKAIRLLAQKNINMDLCYVLGFPGENKNTLQETYGQIQSLPKDQVYTITISLFTPGPGSPAYKMLSVDGHLPLSQLHQIWFEKYCPDLNWDDIFDFRSKLEKELPVEKLNFLYFHRV